MQACPIPWACPILFWVRVQGLPIQPPAITLLSASRQDSTTQQVLTIPFLDKQQEIPIQQAAIIPMSARVQELSAPMQPTTLLLVQMPEEPTLLAPVMHFTDINRVFPTSMVVRILFLE